MKIYKVKGCDPLHDYLITQYSPSINPIKDEDLVTPEMIDLLKVIFGVDNG